MSPSSILTNILLAVRRRFLWIHGAAGVAWGLATAAVLVALGVWLDLIFDFAPSARIVVMILASIAAIGALGWLIARAGRRSRLHRLAGTLDALAGTTGQIQSGLDLAIAKGARSTPEKGLTRGLAEIAIVRAGEFAGRISKSRAVSTRPITRSGGALAGLGLITGALVLLLPRLSGTEWLRFIDPFGDHPPYSAIQFTVKPAGARVVYGKGLDIDVETQGGAVDQVELVLLHPGSSADKSEEVLPMFPVPGGGWRASLTEIKEPLTYFARDRRARSQRYGVTLATVPQIESVDYRIVAPAYTRTPVYEGGLPRTGLSGLRGTVVEVHAHSNRPLRGGTMTVVDSTGRQTQTLPAAEQTAIGQFTIDRSCRLEIRVTDIDGETSTDSVTAPVTMIADEKPFVRLMEPRQLSLATPDVVLPVAISAEDDFGIAHCDLYRSLNGSPYSPMDVRVPAPPARQVYETVVFPFSTYGLSPGDEVKVFARAADNDPAAPGGKGSESTVAVVRIVSQADLERLQQSRDGLEMLLSKYQEAERRMESLQDEVEQLQKKIAAQPSDRPLDENLRKKMDELNKRFAEESEALRKLADRALPYDLDKQLSPNLRKLADELARLSKTQKLGGAKGMSAAEAKKQLEAALAMLKQNRDQLNRETMAPVQFVAAIVPLMQDEDRFIQIYQHQRDLAERLASFKTKERADEPAMKARMRDLEDEQRGLQKDLESLLDDIEDHANRLPDDPSVAALRQTAQKFAADVRSSGATEAMSSAAAGLAEFSGRTAHIEATMAADILEKFIHRCHGMGGECKNCLPKFSPSLGECMSKTCQQLKPRMGFGGGGGFGFGSGNGYSSNRGPFSNVGLYGNLPMLSSSQTKTGSGSDRRVFGMMREKGKDRTSEPGDALHVPGVGKQHAEVEAAVPPAYRQRTNRYFQRIADEVGNR